MNKIAYTLLFLLVGAVLFSGCDNDNPSGESIFVDPTGEKTEFEKWLKENYVDPYNVRVAYRLEDIETDFDYNVVPADLKKSKQMVMLMKHLWIEAYEEVAEDGLDFIRTTIPKHLHLVGSAEHNAQEGTIRLGVAEGGMKITITEVNNLQPYNIVNQNYFGTIHHEFAHVLHQTKEFAVDFNEISASDYAPTTWFNRKTEAEYLPLGFITNYAGSQPREDFVEIISRYVTWPRTEWDRRFAAAGPDGQAKITKKLNIAKTYMQNTWGVNLDELYRVVQRRANEIQYMDFDNLNF